MSARAHREVGKSMSSSPWMGWPSERGRGVALFVAIFQKKKKIDTLSFLPPAKESLAAAAVSRRMWEVKTAI